MANQTNLIHNEVTKLTATYLNGIAIAVFAVGSFAPTVTSLTMSSSWILRVFSIGCLLASAALHLVARLVLKGLRRDN